MSIIDHILATLVLAAVILGVVGILDVLFDDSHTRDPGDKP